MSIAVSIIPKRELLAYQADVKGSIFRQIRQIFARLKESGFTQKELATRIGMDEGQLSRRLRGDDDMQLETLSDLARGLNCRIDVHLVPLNEVVGASAKAVTVQDRKLAREANRTDDLPLNDNNYTAVALAS